MDANAAPRSAELVVDNVQIEPAYPIEGESIAIIAEVYNAGIMNTNSFSSIITAAYFVDGKLLYLDGIGNVEPGLSKKIKISSGPIWNAQLGNHDIKVIIDYHDTLRDEYDSPSDNFAEKTFSIKSRDSVKILLNSTPPYVIQDKITLLQVRVNLVDSDSNEPLNNKKIILNIDGEDVHLTTDKDGETIFSKMVNSPKSFETFAFFEGDDQYLPSNSSLIIHSVPEETLPAIMVKITDEEKKFNFEDYAFEFLFFQDSYETLIKKVSSTILDSNTFWISLPPEHDYFSEVYVDGRFIFLTDKKQLKENSVIVEDLIIPKSADIRFRVINENGEPQSNVIVNNWIYSAITDENGFTNWISVLPTVYDNPYVAELIVPGKSISESNPFLVFSGERKTIVLIIKQIPVKSEIPNWIKNNAGWWANDDIDDNSFVQGMQFLIEKGIMKIPPTTQREGTGSIEIPNWIKNNAGWWANDDIDDNSFVQGMQFLIEKGIMKIQ